MKNVFKFLGIALVAVIIFTIAACKKNKEQLSTTNQSSTPSVAVEESSSNDELEAERQRLEAEREYLEQPGPPPDLPGTWERVGGGWQRTFNYEKILNGNLWDFTGSWKNGKDQKKYLNTDGTFEDGYADGQTASGFTRQNNPKQASGGDFYMWGLHASEGGGFAVALFPVGVDVMGYEGIIPTDKTKVRLTMGQDLPSSSAEVFYLEW